MHEVFHTLTAQWLILLKGQPELHHRVKGQLIDGYYLVGALLVVLVKHIFMVCEILYEKDVFLGDPFSVQLKTKLDIGLEIIGILFGIRIAQIPYGGLLLQRLFNIHRNITCTTGLGSFQINGEG